MISWNETNTIFIMAPKGCAKKNIEKEGIKVYSPYFGDELPLRLFREACFRLPLLPKKIWYEKEFLKRELQYVIIIDVNITVHYLKWIKRQFPNSKIIFLYDNMVGKARNISPKRVPEGIRIWTYDDFDSRKYQISLTKNYWIREMLHKKKKKPEFDVFFIGKDKGRGEWILEFERKLLSMGLKTKFIITKDKKFSRNKKYYQDPISYEEVLDIDTRSRAILNVTMENQEGISMRDMESIAIGVKLITTNTHIVSKDLYNKHNIFIVGVDDITVLPAFLDGEYVDVLENIGDNHTFEKMMDELTS